MKKILLGTTTLFGAALLAGAAHAEGPKVTVGGFADFQYGAAANQDLSTGTTRGTAFRSDTEVTFRVDGKTDAGLGYGGGIDLEADTSPDTDVTTGSNVTTNASRTFVYLDGAWGRLQGGSDYGVSNTMKIDASKIARATGGIDGDFTYFLNVGTTAEATKVIATPDLVLDYGYNGTAGTGSILGDETTETANKISYYTPRFSGFQAGVSYVVDAANKGQTIGNTTHQTGVADNILVGAINWEGKFDQVGISLGATGEHGNAEATTYEDLRTWQVGAKLTYMGFALAGSYGDWGDSLRLKSLGNVDANFWTLGASYEMGAFGASVTYLDSKYEGSATTENEFSNLSIGADYKLAPGFTPYAEVSFIDMDPTATANDNKATVFIAGTQLSF